ncbi:Undecaprenyl-phosphate 4-deoxy-4-formamido-L-arabinose transferase [uncultured archaeon]|nr:Undecaprenyl-phosphate 4-deoxy-4-formamido-L-arabinose transferase [uncultured archaeon]
MRDYKDFTIVLPTLNEDKTVGKILGYVTRAYPGMRMMVADDGSTDATKKIVRKLALKNRNITLLDRAAEGRKKGLTASVIDAIGMSGTRFAIVMDADMQHPVGKIADVAKSLEEGNALAVAVRVKVTDWDLYRKTISRILMYMGRAVLYAERKETCGDIFSGFFGIEREVAGRVYHKNKNRFVPEGYKVLFDLLKCVDRGTMRIAEVPYVFRIRKFGSSKAGFKQGMALLRSFMT